MPIKIRETTTKARKSPTLTVMVWSSWGAAGCWSCASCPLICILLGYFLRGINSIKILSVLDCLPEQFYTVLSRTFLPLDSQGGGHCCRQADSLLPLWALFVDVILVVQALVTVLLGVGLLGNWGVSSFSRCTVLTEHYWQQIQLWSKKRRFTLPLTPRSERRPKRCTYNCGMGSEKNEICITTHANKKSGTWNETCPAMPITTQVKLDFYPDQ